MRTIAFVDAVTETSIPVKDRVEIEQKLVSSHPDFGFAINGAPECGTSHLRVVGDSGMDRDEMDSIRDEFSSLVAPFRLRRFSYGLHSDALEYPA